MKPRLYHEAKLASLSYILVLRYIYAPFHQFTGCDTVITSCHLSPEIIGVVFAYMFFYTIKKL